MDENFKVESEGLTPVNSADVAKLPDQIPAISEKDKAIRSLSGDVDKLNEALIKAWEERDASATQAADVFKMQEKYVEAFIKIGNILQVIHACRFTLRTGNRKIDALVGWTLVSSLVNRSALGMRPMSNP